jgi:hypothetical protein
MLSLSSVSLFADGKYFLACLCYHLLHDLLRENICSHVAVIICFIICRGKIFARMLPEQKIHLIEALKNMG